MELVTENLPLILCAGALALFLVGLVLGLRTEGGRDALAAAAVRLAVTALGLAEKWLGRQVEPVTLENGETVYGPTPVSQARTDLRHWLDVRKVES